MNWIAPSASWLADRLVRTRGVVLRFGDFVEDPLHITARLVASAGVASQGPAEQTGSMLDFGANHVIAGNPTTSSVAKRGSDGRLFAVSSPCARSRCRKRNDDAASATVPFSDLMIRPSKAALQLGDDDRLYTALAAC